MRTRHRVEILPLEPTRLLLDQLMNFGHGQPVAGRIAVITVAAIAGVGHWLNYDAGTLLEFQAEFNQRAQLVTVVALGNCRHDHGRDVELLDDFDAFHLHVNQFNPARFRVDPGAQGVELERRVHSAGLELLGKFWVICYAATVSRDQQTLDLAGMGATQDIVAKLEELRVQRRLAAGKQHDGQLPFSCDEKINRLLEVVKRHRVALLIPHNANRTSQIADVVYFQNGGAGVLQVVLTQTAVERAAMLDFSSEAIRHRSRFSVRQRLDVVLGIARNLDFEATVLRTLLLHPDAVVTQHNVGVNNFLARRTNGTRVGEERGVAILFCRWSLEKRAEWNHVYAPLKSFAVGFEKLVRTVLRTGKRGTRR